MIGRLRGSGLSEKQRLTAHVTDAPGLPAARWNARNLKSGLSGVRDD